MKEALDTRDLVPVVRQVKDALDPSCRQLGNPKGSGPEVQDTRKIKNALDPWCKPLADQEYSGSLV